jgi:RNA polymerase sigma-70 factor (ECF subfamily)
LEVGNYISVLIEKISGGDLKAFELFYNHYYNRLFKFSIHITKSEKSSEEVVSDVFFNLWQKREKLTDINNIETYLFRSVKNKSLSYIRDHSFNKHVVLDSLLIVESGSTFEDPEQILIKEEIVKILQREIDILPDRCRLIFKLVKEDGMKYKQISNILGISVRTIDAQISIATKRITEALKKHLN